MKKTKLLMTAMALPMLFAACSQDELVDDYGVQKGPDAEGFYATLSPSFDGGVDSRATWAGTKLTWDTTDKISLYWLGATDALGAAPVSGENTTNAKYQFNSVFKTTDGYSFESESMVFVGGNVAVYPANTGNFNAGGNVVLEVPAAQNVNTIKNIPYISNYLNVQSRLNQTDNNPGYNKGIDAPMKMAANVLNLTFELKNTAGLSAYGFAVESVELVADDAFATQAVVNTYNRRKYDADGSVLTWNDNEPTPYYGSEQEYQSGSDWVKVNTITKNLWVTPVTTSVVDKLTTTAITKNANGTYTAQFVILPTNKPVTAGKIIINTTCGHVDIAHVEDVLATTEDESQIVIGGADGTQSLNDCLAAVIADDYIAYSENSTSKFMGEKTGRVFPRSIVADMNNATLNNSNVYTSADIIRYVNIYNKMGKENTTNDKLMNLVLSSTNSGVNNTFAGLTKAALAAVDGENNYSLGIAGYKNVTLSAGNIAAVEISNAGEVYDIKSLTNAKTVDLVLAAGTWTMNDALVLNGNINKICNKGTLTIKGTTDNDGNQNILKTTVCNEGTLKIGGNNLLQVPGNLTTAWGSTTEIAAGQNLVFTAALAEGNHLYGTFNVNDATSFLTAATGINITNEAVINNWGTVAAEGGVTSNGFINKKSEAKIGNTEYEGGIINVKGAQAFTYVHDNAEGTINMLTRTDEIMVASALKGSIVYPYTAADGSAFAYTIDDRFNTVEFGSDVANLTLIEEGTDLDGDEEADMLSIKGLSFIFNGTTTLKAAAGKNFEIDKLTVNSGANLRLTTGNKLTVNDLDNNGIITVGGYIYYKNSYDKGTVYSQGGAIKKYDTTTTVSYAQELANAAITEALGNTNRESTVTLDRNIELNEALVFQSSVVSRAESSEATPLKITLDLNGKTIKNDVSDVIVVYPGVELTITGNGKVLGATTNNGNSCAVWADGGDVIIENGTFQVGSDGTDRNDCIYAKNGGTILIKGGEFEYTGTVLEAERGGSKDGNRYLLNLKDDTLANGSAGDNNVITVAGGKFWRFNPAAHTTEPAGGVTSYLQLDPVVYSYATQYELNKQEESVPSTNAYQYSWKNTFFTVK